jgi:hypothetical protein
VEIILNSPKKVDGGYPPCQIHAEGKSPPLYPYVYETLQSSNSGQNPHPVIAVIFLGTFLRRQLGTPTVVGKPSSSKVLNLFE